MIRYVIRRTMLEGPRRGAVCHLGTYGYAVDPHHILQPRQAYSTRASANAARRRHEQFGGYSIKRRYEVVPVDVQGDE